MKVVFGEKNRFRQVYYDNGGSHHHSNTDVMKMNKPDSKYRGEESKSSCRSHQPQEDINSLLPPNTLK